MLKRYRFWILYSAAWSPYAISYYILFAANPSLRRAAAVETFYNIAPAFLLGLAALRWCQAIPWLHRRPWFYPLQILSGAIYSLTWLIAVLVVSSLGNALISHKFIFGHFSSYALQWQFFSGLMVYGNIAGFTYVSEVNRNLREEERRREAAEALKAKAELAALRAQLNPHFLFNTLNSLLGLMDQNTEDAKKALTQLADMLRYALRSDPARNEDDVSLREELHFAEAYLALERLRLGDRLHVERCIDPGALQCRLPALTIQPLVENAIRHGIAPRSRRGTLTLTARREQNALSIVVSDDGVGAETARALTAAGTGIRTVRQRLMLYSKGAATLEIEGTPGSGFAVSIVLPLDASDEENLSVGETVGRDNHP
ncbi:sensor histidine kinase [Acidicapsa dinghuensis]|uniref:Sensor histidine kinase n=1 Tax=Acidicapsa dinghuensis TaxID=2218256 RepID=A0ABW1EE59_9BACT|nr:histidine kinase [Acidicapsa dinghuensis]